MKITLPYPPSNNTYYRNVRGRTLISEKGRHYRAAVGIQLLVERATKLNGRLSLHIIAKQPDKRRHDLDNICKGLLDAMQHGGLYDDDSQIDRLLIERGSGPLEVEVTIEEIG